MRLTFRYCRASHHVLPDFCAFFERRYRGTSKTALSLSLHLSDRLVFLQRLVAAAAEAWTKTWGIMRCFNAIGLANE